MPARQKAKCFITPSSTPSTSAATVGDGTERDAEGHETMSANEDYGYPTRQRVGSDRGVLLLLNRFVWRCVEKVVKCRVGSATPTRTLPFFSFVVNPDTRSWEWGAV